MSTLILVFLSTALIIVYAMPALVSVNRRHRNRLAIMVLNLLTGWMLLGWVIAMVWACTNNVECTEIDKSISEAELPNNIANSQLNLK